jgi:hypothetical protein
MTSKEAADLANGSNFAGREKQIQEFLFSASPQALQDFIHRIPIYTTTGKIFFDYARTALDIRLAENAKDTADKLLEVVAEQKQIAEESGKQTRTLIRLTWGLVIVSAALLAFAAVQTAIMFKQDAGTNTQHIQAGQHQEGATPQK